MSRHTENDEHEIYLGIGSYIGESPSILFNAANQVSDSVVASAKKSNAARTSFPKGETDGPHNSCDYL